MSLIEKLKQNVLKQNIVELNLVHNREVFLQIVNFFERYIKEFSLENFNYNIDTEYILQPSLIRQMKMKGNLVSTIFGSKT